MLVLNLDYTRGTLTSSRANFNQLAAMRVHQGDRTTAGNPNVELWLLNAGATEATAYTPFALPDPFTKMIVAARWKDDLTEASLLFEVTDFESSTTGGQHYTGLLNANTPAIAAKFPGSNRTLQSINALVDITWENDDGTAQETPIKQFPCIITRDIYRDSDTVDTLGSGLVRVKGDGSFQLWNADQSTWHTISVVGAVAGTEEIHIGAGE